MLVRCMGGFVSILSVWDSISVFGMFGVCISVKFVSLRM